MPDYAIQISHLTTKLGDQVIHKGLQLEVKSGEILAIVGGSGAGKTTLLNCMLMLITPESGEIKILGKEIGQLSEKEKEQLRTQCSIMFQGGALFSELSVLENVLFPMQQHSALPLKDLKKLALLKIGMAGLNEDAIDKYPRELSGGMVKRASLARSLALDPQILFLDELSSGLDPVTANGLDHLILELRASLKLTVILVTHDLDTLAVVPDRIAFLGKGKVLACDTLPALLTSSIPEVQAYFKNSRAQRTFGE